jgi:large subunit ribosomal protein L1
MMPNPKMGTVTNDIGAMVAQIQAGRLQFRVDKTGNVHAGIGKVSFSEEQLAENVAALCREVMKAKPASVKKYVQSAAMSSTMGPGFRLPPAAIETIGVPVTG